MINFNKKQHLVDLIGLMFLGIVSLGYVIFTKPFAELHLQFKFLDFPIFTGEISLFIGLIVFCVKYINNPQKLTKWHYLILSYFAFVIIKALYGYFQWSPLALRHAALFYYPVFAVFGYAFYRRDFFEARTSLFLLVIIFAIFLREHSDYCILTLVALGLILIASFPHKILKFLMFLILLIIIPYKEFFPASRMMIVSNFLSGLYLAGALPAVLKVKKKFKFAFMTLIGGIFIVGLLKFADHGAVKSIIAFKKMAEIFRSNDAYIKANNDHFKMEELKRVKLYNPDKLVGDNSIAGVASGDQKVLAQRQMKAETRQIVVQPVQEKSVEKPKPSAEPIKKEVPKDQTQIQKKNEEKPKASAEPIKREAPSDKIDKNDIEETKTKIRKIFSAPTAKIISDEKPLDARAINEIQRAFTRTYPQITAEKSGWPVGKMTNKTYVQESGTEPALSSKNSRTTSKEFKPDLPIVSADKDNMYRGLNTNAVFRLFIWRDMLADLVKEKRVLGFDFGKPFRSKSLEILNWGNGDWVRDGWIGAHNSYMEIIYRMGIIGILLILGLWTLLFKMIRKFILAKSFTGILLCGIIINWFTAANFLLIFELPYTAIPIWTIYGVTVAYCYKTETYALER